VHVGAECLHIEKYFPEALFYKSQELGELDVAEARDHVVGHRMVLVSQEDRELRISREAFVCFVFKLAVDQDPLDEEVEANQKLEYFVGLVLCVEENGDLVDSQNLWGKFEQSFGCDHIEQEVFAVDPLQGVLDNLRLLQLHDLVEVGQRLRLWLGKQRDKRRLHSLGECAVGLLEGRSNQFVVLKHQEVAVRVVILPV
jgi:hypothetical protein